MPDQKKHVPVNVPPGNTNQHAGKHPTNEGGIDSEEVGKKPIGSVPTESTTNR